jgi:AraC-like DNA-binding protein
LKKKPSILLHTNELQKTGVKILLLNSPRLKVQAPHRDDHYMFVLQKNGVAVWEVDFEFVKLSGPSVCFIAPGQVHRYIHLSKFEGWLIFVDSGLISSQSRDIFYTHLNARQETSVKGNNTIFKTVTILADLLNQGSLPLHNALIASVTDLLSGLIASSIVKARHMVNLVGSQKYSNVLNFKQLVAQHYRSVKQVKAYAGLLHVTPLYLNEMVKEVTGFTASYWINQEIILEAKRLLYYTSLDIKQIAYELGYDDHAYFSRFFKKNTGITASEFKNRKP